MPESNPSIGFLLNDVARLMRRNFNRRVQAMGLSQSQWRALGHLAKMEGINQVTLADRLEIQPITLARLIDRLQDSGLVERRPDPTDRRAIRLFLTPAAAPLIAELHTHAAALHGEALDGISQSGQATLRQALQTMKDNLAAAEDGAANDAHEEKTTVRIEESHNVASRRTARKQ